MTDEQGPQRPVEETPAERASAAFSRQIRERLRRAPKPRPANPEPDPLIERLTRRKEADER